MSPFQSRCHNGRARPASNRSSWLTLRPQRGAATARGALGWYIPSVGVPRDVGCRALRPSGVYAANSFSAYARKIRLVYCLGGTAANRCQSRERQLPQPLLRP